MVEQLREVDIHIKIRIDTNKATYTEYFDDLDEAKAWLESTLEDIW